MKITIDPEIRKKLKAGLPSGANKRIAKELRYSEQYVSGVLNGRDFNEKVYEAFLKAYQEHQEYIRAQNQKGKLVLS